MNDEVTACAHALSMAERAMAVRVGESLTSVGVLVTASTTREMGRGFDVRVHGRAVSQGLVALTRVRARPWSARLAPWQMAGWEHTVTCDGDSVRATLREATTARAVTASSPRQLLALAVWVELVGTAAREGEGELWIDVTGRDAAVESVRAQYDLRVEATPRPTMLSAYLAWDGDLAGRAPTLRELLDGLARDLAAQPTIPRALASQVTVRKTLYLRPGCVVLGEHGAIGDARFESAWNMVANGNAERMILSAPCPWPSMHVGLARPPRVRDAPVEMTVSFSRDSLDERGTVTAQRALLRMLDRGDVLAGFVAEHPFVSALAERTPWEANASEPAARTVATIRVQPRIDPDAALAYRGPR